MEVLYMPSTITVTIPENLYKRAEGLAKQRNQNLADLLDEALSLAERSFSETKWEEEQMALETAAYEKMHADLMARYAGEYVAIYQGQLVDHDADELALLKRIDAKYPHEIVLLKQVRPLPEPELRSRSPRLLPN